MFLPREHLLAPDSTKPHPQWRTVIYQSMKSRQQVI